MKSSLSFPTALHAQLAQTAHDFFKASPQVDTVLVVNSCARGQATPESDLDLAILVTPATMAQDIQALESAWQRFMRTTPLVQQFRQSSQFAQIHADIFNGHITPPVWDDGGGPDGFELEIGNFLLTQHHSLMPGTTFGSFSRIGYPTMRLSFGNAG